MNGGDTQVRNPAGRVPETDGAPLSAVPSDAAAFPFESDLRALRADTRSWAVDRDIVGTLQDDLVLTIDELAANSLRHGGGSGELRLWTEGSSVVAEVADSGWIRDLDVGRSLPPMDQIDGRGLWIVANLTDHLQIRTGPDGTVVRAHFGHR
jgi:anti-sigma regulatory factor (Ser/Thr protein kinase)